MDWNKMRSSVVATSQRFGIDSLAHVSVHSIDTRTLEEMLEAAYRSGYSAGREEAILDRNET